MPNRTPFHQRAAMLGVCVAACGAFLAIRTAAHAAWVDPTSPPTGGNVSAAINTSDVAQTKDGSLTIGSGEFIVSAGDLFFSGGDQGIFWNTTTTDTAKPHVDFNMSDHRLYLSPGSAGDAVVVQSDLIIDTNASLCFGTDCNNTWSGLGGGSGVSQLNTLTGDVNIVGDANIAVTPNSGNGQIGLSCPGCGGSSIWTLDSGLIYPADPQNANLMIGGTNPSNAEFWLNPISTPPLFAFKARGTVTADPGAFPLLSLTNNGSGSQPSLNITQSSGISLKAQRDVRFYDGDLKVLTSHVDPVDGPVQYGVRISNGEQADISSTCKLDNGTELDDCSNFDDSLYVQNNQRQVYFSPDSGDFESPGIIGIGTSNPDANYKLTIGTGKVDENALKVYGRVDIVGEDPPGTGPGSLTVIDDLTVGNKPESRLDVTGEICLNGVCRSTWP